MRPNHHHDAHNLSPSMLQPLPPVYILRAKRSFQVNARKQWSASHLQMAQEWCSSNSRTVEGKFMPIHDPCQRYVARSCSFT